MKKNRKMLRRNHPIVIFVLVAAIFFAGTAGVQAGRCEQALQRCLHDPLWMNMIGSLFCLNGYIFCKTYIEN